MDQSVVVHFVVPRDSSLLHFLFDAAVQDVPDHHNFSLEGPRTETQVDAATLDEKVPNGARNWHEQVEEDEPDETLPVKSP